MTSVPIHLTQSHPCSYFDDKQAQSAFVHPAFNLTPTLYSRLIEHGFRRSGDDVYKPACQSCRECIAVRLPAQAFRPNRNQRRCFKKNQHTQAAIRPAKFNAEHYQLYLKYQNHRHPGGNMATSSADEYIGFMNSIWCESWFVEFSIDNQLCALAVVDRLDNGLSAVYTFFDPDFSAYSPGTYAVLWQIEQAKKLQLNYVYLGYWIKNCSKMSYKNQYQPLYGYIDNQWRLIS